MALAALRRRIPESRGRRDREVLAAFSEHLRDEVAWVCFDKDGFDWALGRDGEAPRRQGRAEGKILLRDYVRWACEEATDD